MIDLRNSPEEIAARLARQLAELARVAEVGLGLCKDIVARMKSPEGVSYDPSQAYEKISRAVRLTIVLENRIAAEHEQVLAGKTVVVREDRHAKAKAVILDVLNGAIETELRDRPEREHERLTDFRERLPKFVHEHVDIEDLLETAPVSAVIEIISEALDIPIDWSLWRDTERATKDEAPQGTSQPPSTSRPPEVDPDTEPVRA